MLVRQIVPVRSLNLPAPAVRRVNRYMPHHASASVKGVSNGAKRTLRSWKLAWSARLRVAAWRRESNDSDFFRRPGVTLRAGFVMPASWAKKKMRCGASDLNAWQFFAPASLRVTRTPQGFWLCWGVSFQDRLGRLIRTISVGPVSVNFA